MAGFAVDIFDSYEFVAATALEAATSTECMAQDDVAGLVCIADLEAAPEAGGEETRKECCLDAARGELAAIRSIELPASEPTAPEGMLFATLDELHRPSAPVPTLSVETEDGKEEENCDTIVALNCEELEEVAAGVVFGSLESAPCVPRADQPKEKALGTAPPVSESSEEGEEEETVE